MHDMSKWILRIVIVLGAIGFGTIYVQRNGWTIAEMPKVFDNTTPASAPSTVAAAVAPALAGPSGSFAPCQPIGRTGRGELVYSMDCQQVPAATEPAAAK
jgi:hypothetical protein